MGYIKGRWSSLRGLRIQIKNAADHDIAVYWVTACLILHNLVLDIEGGIDELSPFAQSILAAGLAGEGGDDQDGDVGDDVDESPGQRKRKYLQRRLFESL